MLFRTLLLSAAVIATTSLPAAAQRRGDETTPKDCPENLPAGTECFAGRDMRGAYYWIAKPKNWNGVLVVHAHGGPRTAKPKPDDPVEDLERFAVTVQEGYAWAGSNYRRQGYGVRMAAADTDNVRRIAERLLGKPKTVLLHGQSWGGNVAAKTAELYALDWRGHKNYDGVVLTSGLLAGGSRGYDFRADLRAVYQYYCKNHPRADEVQYPVWQGLPKGASMKREELEKRVDECTGLSLAKDKRSPEQARNLANILAVTHVPEKTLVAHLAWATGMFQDIIWRRLDGKNPFDNSQVQYKGSDDDAALNKGVERFKADPQAHRAMVYDAASSGQHLPSNWESSRFKLPLQLREAIPHVGEHETVLIVHNDAVVQGLSEAPFMKNVSPWGIFTIGTGLGNALFKNR